MKAHSSRIPVYMTVLLLVSAGIRALLAGSFDLGNDEVYYRTYAVYPDLSHFDHPPMVGWLIRIFTINLNFQQEFFIRLASVVGGTLSTWLIFQIGKSLKDELTGWYAALLFTASLYGFVITGIFILPDTPQMVFWLSALLLLIKILPVKDISGEQSRKMVLAGLLLGLGMLSKYTTVFLWAGTTGYILIFNRQWLRKPAFYFANLLMIISFFPVILWNIRNGFVSFSFQGERGLISELLVNYNTFLTELGGEFLYQNPVLFILLILSLASLSGDFRHKISEKGKVLLLAGVPVIVVFLILSLFRSTLPHWSGPGYVTLLPFVALWIRERKGGKEQAFNPLVFTSVSVIAVILIFSALQIRFGLISPGKTAENSRRFEDYSLEIYGWDQLGKPFRELSARYEQEGSIQEGSPIISYRWFPAANLEYYAGLPSGRNVLVAGSLEQIHKYAWINRIHGGFKLNSDAWYISSSRDFRDPLQLPGVYYGKVMPPDTIPVMRGGKNVYQFYVYRLINLQSKPEDPLLRFDGISKR